MKVIVKHLPAIQNLGSLDVLCSDKTGTLTAGVMQFDQALIPRAVSLRPFTLAYINSHFETGIRSPFDAAILQHDAVDVTGFGKVDEFLRFERRRLSIVTTAPGDDEGARLLITKGAPNLCWPYQRHLKRVAASRR